MKQKIFIVLPYFNDGMDINTDAIKLFSTHDKALQYIQDNKFISYDVVYDYLDSQG